MRERFALGALPWQAWKNGAGRTREIAVEPAGAGPDDFGWRVSVAEVDADAPFSAYPGVERCITLLHGAGLRLHSGAGELVHVLDQALVPWRFDGGLALTARLIAGPCLDFNLMTRRGAWHGELQRIDAPQRIAGADALLVLATDGAPTADGVALRPEEGLLWRTPRASLGIGGAGTLLAVRLTRHPER